MNQEIKKLRELAGIQGPEDGIKIHVPENTDYKEFAKAVADYLEEHYGSHNYEPFAKELIAALKDKKTNNEDVAQKGSKFEYVPNPNSGITGGGY